MGVFFTESRAFPKELKSMGHYRGLGDTNVYDENLHGNMNAETSIASIFKSITTGAVDFFGGTSSEAKAAQANAAATQAQVYGQQAADAEATKRTLIMAGAGVVGVLVLVMLIKAPAPVKVKVGGYKRRRSHR